jgi:small ubiquitin-related modifier
MHFFKMLSILIGYLYCHQYSLTSIIVIKFDLEYRFVIIMAEEGKKTPPPPENPQDHQGNPEETSSHIKLMVRGQDGNEIVFKVKKTTLMGKLMKSYNERMGVPSNTLRFLYDGKRINNDDTALTVNTTCIYMLKCIHCKLLLISIKMKDKCADSLSIVIVCIVFFGFLLQLEMENEDIIEAFQDPAGGFF